MTTDFIGSGLAVRRENDDRFGLWTHGGSLATVSGDTKVAQSIEIILRTTPGERPMRPEFGCPLVDYVFSPADASTAGQVAHEVRRALERWEPRIVIEEVDVRIDPGAENCLLIDITYRLAVRNDRRNLVFPFYVIPNEG